MLVSAALLLLWLPNSDSPKAKVTDVPATVEIAANAIPAKAITIKASLPEAPAPKVEAAADPAEPAANPFPYSPVKSAVDRPVPSSRQIKLWYTFMAVSHGAAAFDAWSTRRAVSGHYGTEADPLMRPFAHSNAIYAATQVSPLVMDYVGRRMLTSRSPLLRRFWWVPQVAGTGLSFSSGMHNYSITQ